MMLKSVITATFLALYGFAIAETPADAASNDLDLSEKCCGSPSHHRRHHCCGCPRKGAVAKVRALTDIFLDFFFADDPRFSNLVDTNRFRATTRTPLVPGPYYCCLQVLTYSPFLYWWSNLRGAEFYLIYAQGETPYEEHSDGCIVVPFDLVTVGPEIFKGALEGQNTVTRAYQMKLTWCPAEGCNWLVTGMEIISYACLNVTLVRCPGGK